VLTSQPPTPLSDLVTEQLVLVLAAGTRDIFARVRERSGRLPGPGGAEGEGRSVLGTVLDPLGVFRGSPLVQNDERDRAALAAAAELAASKALGTPGDQLPALCAALGVADAAAARLMRELMLRAVSGAPIEEVGECCKERDSPVTVFTDFY